MEESKYIIVGGSHAGLSALDAIRVQDQKGVITLVTREEQLPYSPTILPYVVSGRTEPERVFLRDAEELDRLGVIFRSGAEVTDVNTADHRVTLKSGEQLGYDKLLLATGAAPVLPPVEGLGEEVPHNVLRTLDDAMALRSAGAGGGSVIVLGAGLIGMHAAENLAEGGMQVTVVEALGQVLPAYFDEEAAGLIEQVFVEQGVRVLTGHEVTRVTGSDKGCVLHLAAGEELSGDLLLVAAGVKPVTGYLTGSGVEVDEGILVDERMRSSVTDVWAAGDVAQACGFFDPDKKVNPTLPNAVEEGRIAGMDMAGDPALKPHPGGIAMNTYRFFGHRAFSVGLSTLPESTEGIEVDKVFFSESLQYQKLVFRDDRLVGASCINSDLDPGIMYQLVRRKVDMKEIKDKFTAEPVVAGRVLMSRIWR